jgi:hypothetical protein
MAESGEVIFEKFVPMRSAVERAESKTPVTHQESVPKTNRQIIEDAQGLVGKYDLDNGVVGEYEITKTDIHNLVYEISGELKGDRETIIPRIRDIIENGEYVGWSADDGTHPDVAYFTYYSDTIGQKIYLGMRYMKSTKRYKPHAIYSETRFKEDRAPQIVKGTPTM